MPNPVRYLPGRSFPPYSYVPGSRTPHPVRDPRGHSYGKTPSGADPPQPDAPFGCREYLYAVDLFNHGYYWEAHEVWEGLWHACGRTGTTAGFLKGLIKLAAAGVKAREGNAEGVLRHARRAAELFAETAETLDANRERFLGLSVEGLAARCREIAENPRVGSDQPGTPPAVLSLRLELSNSDE